MSKKKPQPAKFITAPKKKRRKSTKPARKPKPPDRSKIPDVPVSKRPLSDLGWILEQTSATVKDRRGELQPKYASEVQTNYLRKMLRDWDGCIKQLRQVLIECKILTEADNLTAASIEKVQNLVESRSEHTKAQAADLEIEEVLAILGVAKVKYLGNGVVDTGADQPIILTRPAHKATLEHLLANGRATTDELIGSGCTSNPSATIRQLHDLLGDCIERPGKSQKGKGYSTTIIDARKN